jgi:hypothetical protein
MERDDRTVLNVRKQTVTGKKNCMIQYNLATRNSHWNPKAPPGNVIIPSTAFKTEKRMKLVYGTVTGRNTHIIMILQKQEVEV